MESQNRLIRDMGVFFQLKTGHCDENTIQNLGEQLSRDNIKFKDSEPRTRLIQSWADGKQMMAFCGPSRIDLDHSNPRVL